MTEEVWEALSGITQRLAGMENHCKATCHTMCVLEKKIDTLSDRVYRLNETAAASRAKLTAYAAMVAVLSGGAVSVLVKFL